VDEFCGASAVFTTLRSYCCETGSGGELTEVGGRTGSARLVEYPHREALVVARGEVGRVEESVGPVPVRPRQGWQGRRAAAAEEFAAGLLGAERAAVRVIEASLGEIDAKTRSPRGSPRTTGSSTSGSRWTSPPNRCGGTSEEGRHQRREMHAQSSGSLTRRQWRLPGWSSRLTVGYSRLSAIPNRL
jgi:hypothetical protein